jgi:predicted secreted protein
VLDEVYPEISFNESGVNTLDLVRIMRKLGIDVDRINNAGTLDELYPEISKEWHPQKNGDLTPYGITDRSRKKVWWLCPQGPDHEWLANPYDRTSGGRGCPFCGGRKVSQTNSFDAQVPWLSQWWHPEKNGSLKPMDVIAGSNRSVWWICREGPDHEWRARVNTVTRGNGCPYCSGKMVSVTNSLATIDPELAAQWNPTKNGSLTPRDLVIGSAKRVWWRCQQNPEHEWETTVVSRMKGASCPFCR